MIATELAAVGLASATLADASPAYLDVARRNLGSRYGSRPTQFAVGDFALTGATLPEADIVTLDRVVCCYPDAESFLRAAAARSRRLLAFTHPRERWFLRAGFALGNFIFRLLRNPFRIFVHSPRRMASVLEPQASSALPSRNRSSGLSISTAVPPSKKLTARKLNGIGSTPWAIECAIT